MSDVEKHKRLVKECRDVLIEHLNEDLESDHVLPSGISIPHNDGEHWVRLHLQIFPMKCLTDKEKKEMAEEGD